MSKWPLRLRRLVSRLSSKAPAAYPWRRADAETVRGVIAGVSPYSGSVKADQAAKAVFNISSAHVPAFVADRTGAPYKNRYNAPGRALGSGGPPAQDARALIDQALSSLTHAAWTDHYYGAVDLNGAGIRYYGDVCLVLRPEAVDGGTLVLDRNSFDLICPPLRARTCPSPGHVWSPVAGARQAAAMSGQWANCLPSMAAHKVLSGGRTDERRITIGMISEGVLADEDYMEVIRVGSFGPGDLAEARVSAGDAAADGLVADRMRRGPAPDWAAMLWRHRLRRAEAALQSAGVRTRVVVSSGRMRT